MHALGGVRPLRAAALDPPRQRPVSLSVSAGYAPERTRAAAAAGSIRVDCTGPRQSLGRSRASFSRAVPIDRG